MLCCSSVCDQIISLAFYNYILRFPTIISDLQGFNSSTNLKKFSLCHFHLLVVLFWHPKTVHCVFFADKDSHDVHFLCMFVYCNEWEIWSITEANLRSLRIPVTYFYFNQSFCFSIKLFHCIHVCCWCTFILLKFFP